MTTPKKQTPQDKQWLDEAGIPIPYNRLSASERLREVKSHKLVVEALKINEALATYKAMIREACDQVTELVRKEADLKEPKNGKGNFTWYNFDRSIRIECSINERIDFDETLIAICQEKLNSFLDQNLEGNSTVDLIKELVKDAFQNTKGRLDAKKVMSLLKYKSKIKHTLYQEAMESLEKSIRRPDSKTYFRVAVKSGEGEYQNVELNFSNV